MRSKKSGQKTVKFWAKVHVVKEEILVAICDEELLGRTLEFNGIKIKISERFFGERKIDEKAAAKLLENATIANLFGNKIVSLANKLGYIDMSNTIKISGVYHAQFVKL